MPTYNCKTYTKSGVPSGMQTITGTNLRSALLGAARVLPIDGGPVRVWVEDRGVWWIRADSKVEYSARPEVYVPS